MEKFVLWVMFFIMIGYSYVDGITHLDSECSQARNSTVNTVYRTNLKNLLDSLAKNAPLEDGFFNSSVGNGSNRVYGLAWCRADVSRDICSECLNNSISIPLSDCPEIKDLSMWTSSCTLRFKNESFFGDNLDTPSSSTYGQNALDDASVFSRGFSMMEGLARNVSNQPLMFATGAIGVGKSMGRYGLGQCSRDLSKLDCDNCLGELLTTYRDYVLNRTGWEMQSLSCGLWYDDVRFYDNDSGLSPSPTPNASGGERWYKGETMLAFVSFLVLHWIA